jgi:hypothetical protein
VAATRVRVGPAILVRYGRGYQGGMGALAEIRDMVFGIWGMGGSHSWRCSVLFSG